MPSFIVLAQQEHCFPDGGGIHLSPVIESQKSPAEIGLTLTKVTQKKHERGGCSNPPLGLRGLIKNY